ncbi:MAG: hypothetical protein KF747_05430 [Nitrospira sp.]|nr:hypothetical protein [Nitrospira sp.]
MLTRSDIVKDTCLRLTITRLGYSAGLIGSVYTIGTDWSGNWYFQLRWLNRPAGKRNRPVSEWSLSLRETDLGDFEQITCNEVQELLKESRPPSKPKKTRRLPGSWKVKRHPNQLRLFNEC